MYIAAICAVLISFMLAVGVLLFSDMHKNARDHGFAPWLILASAVSHLVTYWVFVQWLEWYVFIIILNTAGSFALHWIAIEMHAKVTKPPMSQFQRSLNIGIQCTTQGTKHLG